MITKPKRTLEKTDNRKYNKPVGSLACQLKEVTVDMASHKTLDTQIDVTENKNKMHCVCRSFWSKTARRRMLKEMYFKYIQYNICIPDLTLDEEPEPDVFYGRYGSLRRNHLREYCPALWAALVNNCKDRVKEIISTELIYI